MRPFVGAYLLLLGLCAGCAADASEGSEPRRETTGATSQAIINGTTSPASQNAVVQLALDTGMGPQPNCTATLVAKNLVLTARHCVGQVDASQTNVTNYTASALRVYVGQSSPQKLAAMQDPAAIGKKLFTSPGTKMIPDIALVLLDRSIENPVATIRLDGGAKVGESLTIVGYGLTQNNNEPAQRMQRTGKKVLQIFPATVEGDPLNEGEFTFSEAACSGDSGGPALSGTSGAVVGVASRVGNGTQPTSTNPAAFCVGDNALDFYTALSAAKSYITQAFKEAGATPTLEEASTADDTSSDGADTSTSNTKTKSSTSSSDDGDTTSATPVLHQVQSSGCSAAPGRAPGVSLAGLGVLAGLLLARRRRANRAD